MRDGNGRIPGAAAQAWRAPRCDAATQKLGHFHRIPLGRHAFSPRTSLDRSTDATASPFAIRLAGDEKAPGVAIHMSCSEVP
jgi:hypothetical protein